MEVFDAELCAIEHALEGTIARTEILQEHGVQTVAVFSDSLAAIRWTWQPRAWPVPAISEAD